jgi:hypothetical protein
MHVLATTAEALLVLPGKGPASSAATLAHIAAVDPPSADVQLREVGHRSLTQHCMHVQPHCPAGCKKGQQQAKHLSCALIMFLVEITMHMTPVLALGPGRQHVGSIHAREFCSQLSHIVLALHSLEVSYLFMPAPAGPLEVCHQGPRLRVPCAQLAMLHVDACLGPVSVMFSAAREPIAAAQATRVFGKIAVARQAAAPPEQYRRSQPVGRCRSVEIAVRCPMAAVCMSKLPLCV